ncbi:hypothetical protein ACYOEI_24415 [Singulisphaera rosea]
MSGIFASLTPRSVAALRKYWPRMVLSSTGSVFTTAQINAGNFYDFNGNGTQDGAYILTGPECLVFFLGGVPEATSTGFGMSGWSKSPVNPFQNTTMTTNRYPPMFEFKPDRLVTFTNSTTLSGNAGPTHFPGYVDALGGFSAPKGVGATQPPFYA